MWLLHVHVCVFNHVRAGINVLVSFWLTGCCSFHPNIHISAPLVCSLVRLYPWLCSSFKKNTQIPTHTYSPNNHCQPLLVSQDCVFQVNMVLLIVSGGDTHFWLNCELGNISSFETSVISLEFLTLSTNEEWVPWPHMSSEKHMTSQMETQSSLIVMTRGPNCCTDAPWVWKRLWLPKYTTNIYGSQLRYLQ